MRGQVDQVAYGSAVMICSASRADGATPMLGSPALFIPGIFVLALGPRWNRAPTAAVKAIKMSAKLVAGHQLHP